MAALPIEAAPAARGRRYPAWLGPALIAIVFLLATAATWRRWPDLLVDYGREVYIAWQLAQGRTLYRDLAYFNGPLSPYVNAALFRGFGTSITVLVAAGLALAGGITALLYGLFSRAYGRLTATAACLVFLVGSAFAHLTYGGNYNFICPYSHEMTHGFALSLALVALLAAHWDRPTALKSGLAGLCLGLAFLTKAEIFAAAAATALAAAAWRQRSDPLRAWRPEVFVAGTLLPPLAALALLWSELPLPEALAGLVGTWRPLLLSDVASLPFYQKVTGLADPAAGLLKSLRAAASVLLLVAAAAAAERAKGAARRRRLLWAAAGAVSAAAGAALHPAVAKGPWLLVGPALPWLCLLVGAAAFLSTRRPSPNVALTGLWALWSVALLGKKAFNVHLEGYGFALAMPGCLLVVACVGYWIPRALARGGGGAGLFRSLALAALAADLFAMGRVSWSYYGWKDYPVGQGGDRVLAYGPEVDLRGPGAVQALERLRALGRDATFVVLPEGVMLNYLARRANPTPYVNFMPPELVMFGEASILAALQERPPDYVVLAHREMKEYMTDYFGVEYGREIRQWVERSYEREELLFHEPLKKTDRFGIEILRKKASRRS